MIPTSTLLLALEGKMVSAYRPENRGAHLKSLTSL